MRSSCIHDGRRTREEDIEEYKLRHGLDDDGWEQAKKAKRAVEKRESEQDDRLDSLRRLPEAKPRPRLRKKQKKKTARPRKQQAKETASSKKEAEVDPPGEDISTEADLKDMLGIKDPPVLSSPNSVLFPPESPNEDKDTTNQGIDLSSHFTSERSSNPVESGLSTPKVLDMTAMAKSFTPRHGLVVPRNLKSDDDCNEGAPGSVGTHSLLSLSAVTK